MTAAAHKYTAILGGFIPLCALWDEDAAAVGGAPLFPSEHSARWFLRTNYAALVEASAIAVHARRILIHPQRFESVATRLALDRARGRCMT